MKRVFWEIAGASWLALSALPLAHYGWSDEGIIGSFCVFIVMPAAVFMIYTLVTVMWAALGPPALSIRRLIILVYSVARDTIRAISGIMRGL